MKDIVNYILDDFATPMNTIGMGAVEPGVTDGVPCPKTVKAKKNKKKMKHIKQYISEASEQYEINGFCILKPGFMTHEDAWLNKLKDNGWQIIKKKKQQLSKETAAKLYHMHNKEDWYNDLCDYMSSGNSICIGCYKDCKNPIKELKDIKHDCRDEWGKDDMRNAMHSSDSADAVKREFNLTCI